MLAACSVSILRGKRICRVSSSDFLQRLTKFTKPPHWKRTNEPENFSPYFPWMTIIGQWPTIRNHRSSWPSKKQYIEVVALPTKNCRLLVLASKVTWDGIFLIMQPSISQCFVLKIPRFPNLYLYLHFTMFMRTIPHICHFFYTTTFWGLKILHSKVRKFATKIASRQNSVNRYFV